MKQFSSGTIHTLMFSSSTTPMPIDSIFQPCTTCVWTHAGCIQLGQDPAGCSRLPTKASCLAPVCYCMAHTCNPAALICFAQALSTLQDGTSAHHRLGTCPTDQRYGGSLQPTVNSTTTLQATLHCWSKSSFALCGFQPTHGSC